MKNKNKIFFLLIFIPLSIFSQEPIIPQARIFQSHEGEIFINRSIPLYFKLSIDSSKTSEHYLLKAESFHGKTKPIFLDKEGLNIFYSPWAIDKKTRRYAYPKRNVVFELYADGKPPITKIHNSETAYSKSDSLFFGKGLRIWFSATDKVSGVEKTYLSINGANYQQYPHDTITFEQGQYYTLKYYSTDRVGNCEKVKSVSFMIDTTKPLTNLVIYGKHKGNILSASGKVSLKPKDAFSGTAKTYYYIDNSPQRVYTKPVSVGHLREGKHILRYYSQDNVKNKEKEQSYKFYIDKTAPLVMSEVIGDYTFINGKAYTSGRSQIQLSAIDNKAGVKNIYYSFDGKNWNLYKKPFSLPINRKSVNISFYAEDNVGNKGKKDMTQTQGSDKIFLSEVDLIPPKMTYSFSNPRVKIFDTTYISSKTKILLKATDSQSGVQNISYTVNDSLSRNYSGAFSLSAQGLQRISAIAMDKVNNMSTLDFFVKEDTSGPVININFSSKLFNINKEKVYPRGTKLTIFAKDRMTNVDKIYYRLNNSSYKEYFKYLTIKQKGNYSLEVKAVDVLGNISVEKFSFKIR